jgi:O-antigen ligase
MKNLEKNYDKIYNIFLIVISSTIIFRKFNTYIIILFVLFNIVFFNKLRCSKLSLIICLIIASPFLLDIFLFWNNISYYEGIKASEKRASLLFLPLLIVSYGIQIDFKKLLKIYSTATLAILLLLFIRYILIFPNFFLKYVKGLHLWEMGYDFSNSFDAHAPALNMHVSFISIICYYFLLNQKDSKLIRWLLFIISLSFVLYINTRVALMTSIIGFIVVTSYKFINQKSIVATIKAFLILTIGLIIFISVFVKVFPYTFQKFTEGSFGDLKMVGRLDEFNNPEGEVFGKLVTRVSIWKSVLELSSKKIIFGYGSSDAREELVNYYKETNQIFLNKYEFPPHNQYLDFLLKFGILGFATVLIYIFSIGYIGFELKNEIIISFFILFFISNITDDFLNRYDGIVFSAFWFSIFANIYLNNKQFGKN